MSYTIDNVGIVVPTLGNRPDLLFESLVSIKNTGCKNVTIVCPEKFDLSLLEQQNLFNQYIADDGNGLTEAINKGIDSFKPEIEIISWLNDDDLIMNSAVIDSLQVFNSSQSTVAVFGKCDYIDRNGNRLFTMKTGSFAIKYIRILPNLIPQPGSFIKRNSFYEAGKLTPNFPLAFDFELFIQLKKLGKVKFINKVVASFRWHDGSMSVEQRKQAVKQASAIRLSEASKTRRLLSSPWEFLIKKFTLWIGSKIPSI